MIEQIILVSVVGSLVIYALYDSFNYKFIKDKENDMNSLNKKIDNDNILLGQKGGLSKEVL